MDNTNLFLTDIEHIRSFVFFVEAQKEQTIIENLNRFSTTILWQKYESVNCNIDVVIMPFTDTIKHLNNNGIERLIVLDKTNILNLINTEYPDYRFKYHQKEPHTTIVPENINITTFIKKKKEIFKYFQINSVEPYPNQQECHGSKIIQSKDSEVLNKFLCLPNIYNLKQN